MRVTAKDFGPYSLVTPPDAAAEYARIATTVPFTAVRGRAAPREFAALLVSGEGA